MLSHCFASCLLLVVCCLLCYRGPGKSRYPAFRLRQSDLRLQTFRKSLGDVADAFLLWLHGVNVVDIKSHTRAMCNARACILSFDCCFANGEFTRASSRIQIRHPNTKYTWLNEFLWFCQALLFKPSKTCRHSKFKHSNIEILKFLRNQHSSFKWYSNIQTFRQCYTAASSMLTSSLTFQ